MVRQGGRVARLQWVRQLDLNRHRSLVYNAMRIGSGDWYIGLITVNGREPLDNEEVDRRVGLLPAADVDLADMRILTLDRVRWCVAAREDPPLVQRSLF